MIARCMSIAQDAPAWGGKYSSATLLDHCANALQLDLTVEQLSRELGFIQGVLAARGLVMIVDELEFEMLLSIDKSP